MKFALSILLLAASCVPAFATHGVSRFQARQIRQGQRAALNAALHHNKVQAVIVPHVQQVVVPQAVIAQPFYGVQQFVAPQQLNSCHNGALQFNAGGCSQLFR